ncbi:MAG: exosortase-associated protein EpsI, B-type [Pseudomonadota bacterium]
MTAQSPTINIALARIKDSWLVLVGLAVLYIPTYIRLAFEVWQESQSFHGALFFLITLVIVWSQRAALFAPAQDTRPILGGLILLAGLVLFITGRSQDFLPLEVISQLPVFIGVLLMVKGPRTLRALWFPIAFLLFLVPLPGSIMDALLMPLKQFVSTVVDQGLFLLGYPIARNGVVLTIGSYQLLIADACAGLNSIIALSGIGFAFVYLAGHMARWHNVLLVASVLPIALLANVLRVAFLTLITYHFGDAMGQRFHDVAGMVEAFLALGTFFLLDWLLGFSDRRIAKLPSPAGGRGIEGEGVCQVSGHHPPLQGAYRLARLHRSAGGRHVARIPCFAPQPLSRARERGANLHDVRTRPFLSHYVIGALALLATGLSVTLMPKANTTREAAVDLEQILPRQFGQWKPAPAAYTLADITPNRDGSPEKEIYDQTALRTFRGPDGTTVMLAVAWGRRQSQEVKIHRPELCYTAQGFKVTDKQSVLLRMGDRTIPATRMITRNSQRLEPVTYWIRLGDSFSRGPVETRLTILKQGLQGNVPDGILVRVSTVSQGARDLDAEFKIQQAFLGDLLDTMSNDGKALMVGNPPLHQVAAR